GFLVDIQPDQWAGVQEVLRSVGATGVESTPVVMARIFSIDGVEVKRRSRTGAGDEDDEGDEDVEADGAAANDEARENGSSEAQASGDGRGSEGGERREPGSSDARDSEGGS